MKPSRHLCNKAVRFEKAAKPQERAYPKTIGIIFK